MRKRIAILLGFVAVIAVVFATGVYEYIRPTVMREWLLGLGPWGPVVYVLGFAFAQLTQLPGLPFLVAASLTWPLPVAFTVAWVGVTLCGLPSFLLTRYVAHDWVQAHLPDRFHRYNDRIAQGGVRTVILLRLVFYLSPLLPPALALSRVRAREFVIGTAIGLLPEVLVWALFGPRLVDWFLGLTRTNWQWAGGVALAVVVAAVVAYRFRRRLPPVVAPLPEPVTQTEP